MVTTLTPLRLERTRLMPHVVLISLPAGAAEIAWTVDQPFRFLRFASDHLIHEMAFEDAATSPEFRKHRVSAMEARLPPISGVPIET